jgi:hypothetical protein
MSIVTLNDRGVRSVTTFGSVNAGSMVFIKKLTASSSSDLSFVNGSSDVVLDSTYKEYLFTFNNIHPASQSDLQVGFRDGGSNYDATVTSTFFSANHGESSGSTNLEYKTSYDLAQSTSLQTLAFNIGTENDESSSGYLHLFNPSSTTFVKHFISVNNGYHGSDILFNNYIAGYCNTTTAIDGVQFKMASGNIDAGDICLYGIL